MVKLMGCFFGKPAAIDDSGESPKERQLSNGSVEKRVNRINSSRRRGGSFRLKEKLSGSKKVRDVGLKTKGDIYDQVITNSHPLVGVVPRALEAEQIAAGWPSWLTSAAAEAINGWVPRRQDSFKKLDKIGQGTYSNVYKAFDLTHNKAVALKRVRFDSTDPESVKFMAREILILRRLDHINIIKLEGLVTSRSSCSLHLVFEYMEHDLTGLASLPDSKFSEPQVKCYMQQLLSGLDHCHSRGVLHRDIKGSNLLIDNNGILKIADFGLATIYDQKQTQPMTSRVVTLWYRPPELLLGASHYGVSVDLWSAGCILGELYACKPIMPGRTEVEQLHKIFKLCGSPSEEYWAKSKLPHSTGFKPVQPYRRRLLETFKNFPSVAVRLMDTLLSIDPTRRGTAADALKSELFTTEPLPCDPSCLPKYTPSKEMDAKLREESRRQGAGEGKGSRNKQEAGDSKPSRALPAPNANAELMMSMQKRQGNPNSISRSELFYHNQHEAAYNLPLDPPRLSQRRKDSDKNLPDHDSRRISHSGPLVPGFGRTQSGKKSDDIAATPSGFNLSTLSGLVASRTFISEEPRDRYRPSESSGASGPLRKNDRFYVGHVLSGSRQMEKGRGSIKEPVLGHGVKKNKIHFSGPLLPNNNVDQMLKEHDRQIQEAARRARIERARFVNNIR